MLCAVGLFNQSVKSNWTEWSTIQGVIGGVISNRASAKREADLKLCYVTLITLIVTITKLEKNMAVV